MQQVRKSAAGVKGRKWSPADRAEYIEILGEHANCPLSPAEIIDWARKLGRPGSDCERELRELLTIAFWNASSSLPAREPFEDEVRVDKRLPEIAKPLGSIHRDLLSLPSDVDAALRVRSGFGEYDKALDNLRALRRMLDELADLWSRPYRGNPSLKPASVAIEMLVLAVEEFTGKRLPAPRTSNLHP